MNLDWEINWNKLFNNKKYLKWLLKRQKQVLDLTDMRLLGVQKMIEEKGLKDQDLFKEIWQICSDCINYHELVSKGSVPDDIENY